MPAEVQLNVNVNNQQAITNLKGIETIAKQITQFPYYLRIGVTTESAGGGVSVDKQVEAIAKTVNDTLAAKANHVVIAPTVDSKKAISSLKSLNTSIKNLTKKHTIKFGVSSASMRSLDLIQEKLSGLTALSGKKLNLEADFRGVKGNVDELRASLEGLKDVSDIKINIGINSNGQNGQSAIASINAVAQALAQVQQAAASLNTGSGSSPATGNLAKETSTYSHDIDREIRNVKEYADSIRTTRKEITRLKAEKDASGATVYTEHHTTEIIDNYKKELDAEAKAMAEAAKLEAEIAKSQAQIEKDRADREQEMASKSAFSKLGSKEFEYYSNGIYTADEARKGVEAVEKMVADLDKELAVYEQAKLKEEEAARKAKEVADKKKEKESAFSQMSDDTFELYSSGVLNASDATVGVEKFVADLDRELTSLEKAKAKEEEVEREKQLIREQRMASESAFAQMSDDTFELYSSGGLNAEQATIGAEKLVAELEAELAVLREASAKEAEVQAERERIMAEESVFGKMDTVTFAQYSNGLIGAEQAMTQMGLAVEETGKKAEEASKKTSTFLSTLASRIVYSAISKTTQMLRQALNEMKAVDTELVTIQKTTGASSARMDAYEKTAYSTAAELGTTASEYLNAVAQFAKAGYGDLSEQMGELAIKTASVGDISQETATSMLLAVNAAYKYGGSIKDLTKVVDGMNEIGNNFATDMDKISEGLGKVSSIAAQTGVGIDELSATLGTITAVTQRSGQEAATALRALFLNIIGDTKTEIEDGATWTAGEIEGLRDVMKMYIPEIVEEADRLGTVINPMEAIGALAEAYDKGMLTEAKLMEMVTDIGGKLRSSQLLTLIQNWDMYEDMLNTYATSAGSAAEEYSIYLDSWEAKTKQLNATWTEFVSKTISSDFAKGFIDGLREIITLVGDLGNALTILGGVLLTINAEKIFTKGADIIGALFTNGSFLSNIKGLISLINPLSAAFGAMTIAYTVGTAARNKYVEGINEEAEAAKEVADQSIVSARNIAVLYAQYRSAKEGTQEYAQASAALAQALGVEAGAIENVVDWYNALTEAETKRAKADTNAARVKAEKALNDAYFGEVWGEVSSLSYSQVLNDFASSDHLKPKAIESVLLKGAGKTGVGGFYTPDLSKEHGVLEYYRAIEEAIGLINEAAIEDESLFGTKTYTILTETSKKLREQAGLTDELLKQFDEAQAIEDFERDMSIGTIESQDTFDGYLNYINSFTDKSETWKKTMVSLARETFPQFSTAVEGIARPFAQAREEADGFFGVIQKIAEGAKESEEEVKTIAESMSAIKEARKESADALYEVDTDKSKDALNTAQEELANIRKQVEIAIENREAIFQRYADAYASGADDEDIKRITADAMQADETVKELIALQSEAEAVVAEMVRENADTSEKSRYSTLLENTISYVDNATKLAEEAQDKAKKALDDSKKALTNAYEAETSAEVQTAITSSQLAEDEVKKALDAIDEQVEDIRLARERAYQYALEVDNIAAWQSYQQADEAYKRIQLLRYQVNRELSLMENSNKEAVTYARKFAQLESERAAKATADEIRKDKAVKAADEASEAADKAEDAKNRAESARDSAKSAKESQDVEAANKAAEEARLALEEAKSASEDAQEELKKATDALSGMSDESENYVAALEARAEAEEAVKESTESFAEASTAAYEAMQYAVEASTNSAARDLLGLVSELEAAKKAIENFGNAGKDEHGGVFADFADMFSTALGLSDKGLFGSKELAAALSGIFGDELMESIGFDTKTASGWLKNNDFIKAAFENGGKDYGIGAANYLKNLIDANDAMKDFVDYSENADGSLNINVKDAEGLAKQLGVSESLIWAMTDAWSIFDSGLNFSTDSVKKLVDEFAKFDGIVRGDGSIDMGAAAKYLFGQGFSVKDIYDIQSALESMGYTLFHMGENGEEEGGGLDNITKFLEGLGEGEEGTEIKIKVTDEGTSAAVQEAVEGVQSAVEELSGAEAAVAVTDNGTASKARGALALVGSALHAIDGIVANAYVNIITNGSVPTIPARASGVKDSEAGLALVNDEAGGYNPELIVDGNRAYIAGGGFPTLVNLNKGATVYTATETRKILGGKSLNGVTIPAFNGITTNGVHTDPSALLDGDKDNGKGKGGGRGKKGSSGGSSKDTDLLDMVKQYMEDILEEAKEARDEQLNLIEKQLYYLKFGEDIAEKSTALEEARMKLIEAEQDLTDAQTERTVRYYNKETGQWEWMADQKAINEAQQSLADAQKDLVNARYDALEEVWKKLEEEIKNALEQKDEVSLEKLLELLKKSEAADTVDSLLELLDDINEFVGNPAEGINMNLLNSFDNGGIAVGRGFMPKATRSDEVVLDGSLASNIISPNVSGNFVAFTDALSTMFGMANEKAQSIYSGNGITNNNGGNTYINGVQIGSDMMNQPLSEILSVLPIYAGR